MTGGRVLVQMNGLGLGGTEINAVQFAAAVREHGYESVLIGPVGADSGGSIHDVAADYGVRVREFELPRSVRAGARLLTGMADEMGADVVHVYSQRRMRAAFLGPCRFARRPLVVTAYEMEISPYTLTGVPLVVGTGTLLSRLAGRTGDVTLISPPVDLDRDNVDAVDAAGFRRHWQVREDEVLITWVGRLAREMKANAVQDLIAATELLGSVVLLIVGSGDAEPDLRARADEVNRRLGRDAIRFTGALADPRAAYAAADITVGMGSSAARALAFGRPLVAVGEAGWSRVFDETTAASVFRDSFWSDVAERDGARRLAQTLRPLVEDPALRARLGRFGRDFAVCYVGLPAMAARLAEVYDRARVGYHLRAWTHDLDLEVAAASHRLTRRWVPSAHAPAEYDLSLRTARVRESRAVTP